MADLNNLNKPVTTDTEPDVLDTIRGHISRAATWSNWTSTTNKMAGLMSAITTAVGGGRSLRLYRRNDANTAEEEVVTLPGMSIGGNSATATGLQADLSGTPHQVKTVWDSTNSLWNLRGYLGSTDQAGVRVSFADSLLNTLPVNKGGTGATSLTGYVLGNGTGAFTASATVPVADILGTLGVGKGGTGSTTLTANSVLLGNGTSAVQTVAPGTASNILVSNGTTWQSASVTTGMKNKIINGQFDIWQRGASGSISAGGFGYASADRWYASNETGISCALSRAAVVAGSESTYGKYYLSAAFTGTGISGSNIGQRIEGVEQFSGRTVTLSFFAADSVATSLVVLLRQNFGTGGSPSASVDTTSVIPIASTFGLNRLTATITLPIITGKTLGTNNNSYLDVIFVPIVANAHTFYLASVQLEYGVATPFEQRPIGAELALCQRYYEKTFDTSVAPANATASYSGALSVLSGNTSIVGNASFAWRFKVEKRAPPTCNMFNPRAGGAANCASDGTNDASVTATNIGTSAALIYNSGASLAVNSICAVHATASSEL